MSLKKTLALGCAAVLLVVSTSGPAIGKTFISIATGGTSGTYYPIGGAIAKATSTKDVKVTAETGNASVANVNLVNKGEIQIAFSQNDIAYWAFKGEAMFKEPLGKLRAVAALYPEHLQMIVAKNAKIATLNDLKGKRVGVGAPGSGTEADVRALFSVAGLSYDDMKVDYLDFGAVTNRFKDDQIDAGVVVAGYPTASIMDLVTTKDVDLLSFDDEFLKKLAGQHPYFIISKIPSGTYVTIDKDIQTPAVMALLVTSSDLPDDVIYEFTKNMFENIEVVQAAHAKAKEITLENALNGLTVPLHPGAAKYFQEKGLKVE